VPKPRRQFIVNWHWRRKVEPAVFRSYRHAAAAIKAWWKVIHEQHKRMAEEAE
jgi:hypothetical protein